ncbi:helix-turn-helix domain-containing protein [Haladaptatus sp. CMAA 1911]|uniref:helix-turn-helix domain-containing protein n=1 Tax=unclassified Haladaptatus TaxID=2622732 RepID=UPI003755367D
MDTTTQRELAQTFQNRHTETTAGPLVLPNSWDAASTIIYEASGLLTERQREFITEAVERGYYDIPRGCTLVELAERFGVSQSAASGVLHRGEGQIIKKFIS